MLPAVPVENLEAFDSFEAVALPHLNDLFRAARHTLGDASEAEDIVQETYLQAWKSFHRFEPGTNIRGWLFKIMFHVMDHHRRKWLRLKWKSDSDEVLLETLTYEPETPQRLTDEDVIAALDKLPENFRAVVLLADVEEFSYKEIAEMLNVPIGTVMSRLNRGRKLLRTALADYAATCGIRPCAAEAAAL
ncbi:MAG TPA: sigma-70 family RNA polymerase sigma factor [Blastocatellia bacterium]|nr:sigma-70 family RNA polymerase sigma factor [Blastocatellia bacterium]